MVKICESTYPPESEALYGEHFAQFPYDLSPFQKHAIEAIVTGNHALVTAHTGSGKTLPAEFAIQYFVGQGKKVIYTAPIKALSNQKYYEFTYKYPHISFGISTGDHKSNPDADVIIMTTEILMNALFQKQTGPETTTGNHFTLDIDRDLACVIFDEVHYINDAERGQVWEKTILMLPPHIQMVMLSATIDNPAGFAKWCERGGITGKTVSLASTNHRVVPLTHYGFLTTNEGIFKTIKDKVLEKDIRDHTNTLIEIKSANEKYVESGYTTITRIHKIFEQKQVFLKRQHVLNNLTLFLRDREMLPAIAFVFSRKQVEVCASEITTVLLEDDSKVPYTIRRECEQIIRKLPNYHEYLELPEYHQVVSLLEKGIGIHHSGMIPILREIVELMISKKYVKLLFATESFAIGLDCPIRTAIFTSLTKFDGSGERYLLSHEYGQMAGRAGRRGIDTIGNVVHCNNLFKLPTQTEYKQILCGAPQSLVSKFRISYPVILGFLSKSEESVPLTTFVDFVNKSMIYDDLQCEIAQQTKIIGDLETTIQQKENSLNALQIPVDVCRKYLAAEEKARQSVNKKRKECEREMQSYVDQYKNLKNHIKSVSEYDALCKRCEDVRNQQHYLQSYISIHVKQVLQVLEIEGFVSKSLSEEDSYVLTDLGKLSAGIAEIHPLVFAKMITSTNQFAEFTPKQLVGLLSCFTDIKVQQDMKSSVPITEDAFLKGQINRMRNEFLHMESQETQYSIHSGIHYENCLMYDVIDNMVLWASDCTTEQESKYFIQQTLGEKGISVGDFTKAVMKISTIARELMAICETYAMTELQHKLSQIDPLILKYITTSQSLYI
jgi:superfamily II RNA helicase